MASDPERAKEPHRGAPQDETESLPFTVEIADRTAGARTLARAATASLARAIFSAACIEYPEIHILLKRGGTTIVDSNESR